jgi:hypothetical protein
VNGNEPVGNVSEGVVGVVVGCVDGTVELDGRPSPGRRAGNDDGCWWNRMPLTVYDAACSSESTREYRNERSWA